MKYDMLNSIPNTAPSAVGWTTPARTYEKMRLLDAAAASLNRDMQLNVKRDSLRSAWTSWYAQWGTFFAKHQSTWQRLLNATESDELAQATAKFEQDLAFFQQGYDREIGEDGKPLAPRTSPTIYPGPEPQPPNGYEEKEEDKGWWPSLVDAVPWWAWVVGGAATLTIGYYAYRNLVELNHKRRALESALPNLLKAQGVPEGIANASNARDYALDGISASPILTALNDPPMVMSAHGHLYKRISGE